MTHRLSSRKLAAALGGLFAISVVAIVNAWQPVGDFVPVLKALAGVTVIAIVGQGALDLWLGLRAKE